MTGLTLWSLWCVTESWADQNVNEGRINALEASEISILLKEFRGVFTPTAASLWSESGDELATRRLSPVGLISNRQTVQQIKIHQQKALWQLSPVHWWRVCFLLGYVTSVNTEQRNLHLLITVVIIWTKCQVKIIQKNDTLWKDFKATSC